MEKQISRALYRRQVVLGLAGLPLVPWARAASANKPIVIGQVASLSGSNGADLGQGLKHGVEACFRAVNASGGVRGQALQLISKDDKYVPEETVRLTSEILEQDRPVALIGYRGTANTMALVESGLLVKQGITLVGTLTGAKDLQGAPGILHLRTSYERELSELVAQIQRMSLSTLSVLYVDDAFGKTGLAAVEQAALATGTLLLAKVPFDKSPGSVESSVQIAARGLATTSAKALLVVAVGEPVYAFIKAFRPLSPYTQVFCMSVVDSAAVVKRCGSSLAAGIGFSQVYPFPYAQKSVLTMEYRKALSELPSSPAPNYFNLEGYVYAKVLVEALRRAQDSPTVKEVSTSLDSLPAMDLGGLRIQIDPKTRNGVRYTDLTVLSKHGRLLG